MNRDTLTTFGAFAFGILLYLNDVGAKWPTTRGDWAHLAISAIIAGVGYAIKDLKGLPAKTIVVLALVPLLVGCSAQAKLQQITAADAQRAREIAALAQDPDGVACATAIATWVAGQPAMNALAPNGILSAYMLGREAHRGVQGGIPSEVHRACAVLVLDAQQTLIRLGLMAAPVPGLGALIPK